MSEATLLHQILEANKDYLAGSPRPLDSSGAPFLVITCIDPRLSAFLEPALGLPRHRALLIRVAGNLITDDTLHSVAVALYVKKAEEIYIVGHTDCGMTKFSAAEVAENFRNAGIQRAAFGDQDLRQWFGAFNSVRDNVVSGIETLRDSGLISPQIKIHGLLFDSNQGSLEVVVDGNLHPASPPLPASSEAQDKIEAAAIEESSKEAVPPPAPKDAGQQTHKPANISTPAAGPEASDSLLAAMTVLQEFIQKEKQSRQLQDVFYNLRLQWRRDKNPALIFGELKRLGNTYRERYPNVPGALLYLEKALRSGRVDKLGFTDLLKRLLD